MRHNTSVKLSIITTSSTPIPPYPFLCCNVIIEVFETGSFEMNISLGTAGGALSPFTPTLIALILYLINAGIILLVIPEDKISSFSYCFCVHVEYNDNQGPYLMHQILEGLTLLNQEFPNAAIFGSTFEAYIDALMSRKDLIDNLPVMSNEIGGNIIYICAYDIKRLMTCEYLENSSNKNYAMIKIRMFGSKQTMFVGIECFL